MRMLMALKTKQNLHMAPGMAIARNIFILNKTVNQKLIQFRSKQLNITPSDIKMPCHIENEHCFFPLTTRATFLQTPPLQREPVHNKTQTLPNYPPPPILPSPACPIFTQWQGSHTVRGDRRGPVRGWLTAVPERMLRDDGWPSRYVMS